MFRFNRYYLSKLGQKRGLALGKILEKYSDLSGSIKKKIDNFKSKGMIEISIGNATCENAAGSQDVKEEFEKLIEASGRDDIIIKQTGCTGRCSSEPIVGVTLPNRPSLKYQSVSVDKVRDIFSKHILQKHMVTEYLLDKKTDHIYDSFVTFYQNGSYKNIFCAVDYFAKKVEEASVSSDKVKSMLCKNFGLFIHHKDIPYYAMVSPGGHCYKIEKQEDIDRLVDEVIVKNNTIDDMIIDSDPLFDRYLLKYSDVGYFNKQTRLTLRNSGIIDPESAEDYIYYQGFEALAGILDKMTPEDVVNTVKESGLRGRGGGGFPTGLKWGFALKAVGDPKYVICNADEGDPGAFMDRSALEGDPYSIVEGMAIGAFATGANRGFIYCRAEYPLAIERLEKAMARCRELNLLGDNILGSDFSFDMEIRLGAGAFVCGEETALIHSIEGKRGQPRIRPPFPANSGLWGKPTTINNVETWANVPVIFLYGADWFSKLGTDDSKGTKVFALAGKVVNTGLIEVPMGTTLREIIYDIGGGIPNGKKIKAIQTGGPSGGCLPAEMLDTKVDYDSLNKAGSIMGSGGMIVLDEDSCMVDVARFFLDFTKDESCGKCTPCREGTARMLEILKRIQAGKGVMKDLDKLERLGKMIQKASLCGLGQTAPNPVLSVLKNFREEFEAHVGENKSCPAGVCKSLLKYTIITDKCIGCTACARICPVNCISGDPKKSHLIDQDKCIKCGQCFAICKFDAITKN